MNLGFEDNSYQRKNLQYPDINLDEIGAFLQQGGIKASDANFAPKSIWDEYEEFYNRRKDIQQDPFTPFPKLEFGFRDLPKEEEKEEEEKKEEPKSNRESEGGEGKQSEYYGDNALGQDRVPFAWQEWGPLHRGLPNVTGNIFDSFKNAMSNASIGLSKGLKGVMGNPTADPGWAKTIEAVDAQYGLGGTLKDKINSDFTMPGAKTPMDFAAAMKNHAAVGFDKMDALHKNIEKNMKAGMTFEDAVKAVPADLQQALQASKFGNITNSSKAMFGRMAMETAYKNTPLSKTVSMQLSPSNMYDAINGLGRAGFTDEEIDGFTNNSRHSMAIDSMTSQQRMNYFSAIADMTPGGAMESKAKEDALQGMLEKQATAIAIAIATGKDPSPGSAPDTGALGRGAAASKAGKEAGGFKADKSWKDISIEIGLDATLGLMDTGYKSVDLAQGKNPGPSGGINDSGYGEGGSRGEVGDFEGTGGSMAEHEAHDPEA